MSRISNLQQVLSQATHVEKVQQVQQIQGDLESARLAAQAQKRSKGKKHKVQNASSSDPIELRDKEEEHPGEKRRNPKRALPEETDDETNVRHIDIRI